MHELTAILARAAFYPSLAYGWFMSRFAGRPWYNRIDTAVILGALPFRSHTRELIDKENVKAIISLNEEHELQRFSLSPEEWHKLGIEYLRLSTLDFLGVPSAAHVELGVNMMMKYCENKRGTVYVHCKAGRRRSATLVACYLSKAYRMNASEAVEFMRKKRPHIDLKEKQLDLIRHYSEQQLNR